MITVIAPNNTSVVFNGLKKRVSLEYWRKNKIIIMNYIYNTDIHIAKWLCHHCDHRHHHHNIISNKLNNYRPTRYETDAELGVFVR